MRFTRGHEALVSGQAHCRGDRVGRLQPLRGPGGFVFDVIRAAETRLLRLAIQNDAAFLYLKGMARWAGKYACCT